ncbi:MAG TPA: GGDEF domain-containing protein [Gammaproteobacteria bacterium]|nr:GGDEF domain-containing protein [Gammaproteobacteria bacterium]
MRVVIGVLYTLLPEFVLFIVAALCVPYVAHFSASGLLAAELASGFILVLVMVLSLQFNRSRIFFVLLNLTGLCVGLLLIAHSHDALTRETVEGVLCLFVPANLLLFSFSEERGIFSRYGGLRFGILAIEMLCIVALLGIPAPAIVAALHVHFVDLAVLSHTRITQPGLLLLSIGLILLNDRLILRHSPELAAFFFSLVAVGIMLHRQDTAGMTVFAAAVAAAFGHAVIQESWNMAYLDELTGLPGRRALEEQMRQLASQHVIAMVDVDHFKRFNDTYGHDVGDQVLRFVASRLQKHAGGGKPFRYGGEEFCILYPGRQPDEVVNILESLRADIETCRFEMRRQERRTESQNGIAQSAQNTGPLAITVSIGMAGSMEPEQDPWSVLKSADKALYAAKGAGRNRVCLSGS